MAKKSLKAVSFLLTLAMSISVVTGCGGKQGSNETTQKSNVTQAQQTTAPVETAVSYPLKTDVTLKLWTELNGNVSASAASLGDTPFAKELEKRTGVKIEYIHPASGMAKEQFNLLLASGELPDLIEYGWQGFEGGPDKAVKDGYIIKLNDAFDKYAPNLIAYLAKNPDVDKELKTDSLIYYAFPFIRGDDLLKTGHGPFMRKDWLDDLKLAIPETMDEWYTVLKAFKEKKGAEIPFSFTNYNWEFNNGLFTAAYNLKRDFFVVDGKVKFGPAEPAYKEFLTTMNKWFNEGLLDNNFSVTDSKKVDANITSGLTGASIGWAGSGMGRYITTMLEVDPTFKLTPVPYPSAVKGQKPMFGQRDPSFVSACTAITTACKNVEIAARWLDYGYGEEGHMLFNFGIENESYTMVGDYPTYTEKITKNPDGLSLSRAGSLFTKAFYNGPFVQDRRYIEQFYSMQEQKDALVIWSDTDAGKYMLPTITALPEESTEVAKLQTEITTYVDEMILKFILGNESIANFDAYIKQLNDLGLGRLTELKQAAVDRFNKR